jgi:hypothetical protein
MTAESPMLASSVASTDAPLQSTSDALSLQVLQAEPNAVPSLPEQPTHVVRINAESLHFAHAEQLKPSQCVWLALRVGHCTTTLMTKAEVLMCDDNKVAGRFDTCVRFTDTSSDFQNALRLHIEAVKNQISRNRREYTYIPGGLCQSAALGS